MTETLAAGRYRVERVLGDGAMAKVVLAEDVELGRRVAVKLLDEQLAEDESFRARFAREARIAAALSHPNVVGVYDVGESENRPFIVMEHVDGRTLARRLADEGPLGAAEACRIGRQVSAGLQHAHAHGMVHRDLKPGNLIERRDGTIKIADFGIARAVEGTSLTEAGTIVGTAAYLAPEQAEGGQVTAAADVFALGVVLYELLTGRQPWQVDSLAALAGRRSAPPPELPPETPRPLRKVIERSLAPEPADRPTMAQVAAMLDAPTEDATMVIPRAPRRKHTPRRRGVWAALAAGLALLAGGAAALFAADRSGDAGGATVPARDVRLEDGATPAEDARNLSSWLRQNAKRP